MSEFRGLQDNLSRMTPSAALLCLMCVLLWNKANLDKTSVHQERAFISADIGDNVTLQCSYDSGAARYYWYKQSLGQKPKLISISYKFDQSGVFYDEFREEPRFILEAGTEKSQLKISNLNLSDTGTYFCVSGVSFIFEFGEGVTVGVKNSFLENEPSVHQSESETAQPGGAVELSCAVQTGSCGGELRVYWFTNSQGSGSDPGLIYSHGRRDGRCVRSPGTKTPTCVYKLHINNLNQSHVGTYYCAVASCGRVVFGQGTRLDLQTDGLPLVMAYSLTAALTFTAILTVLLIFILDKMNNEDSNPTGLKLGLSGHPAANSQGYQDASCLHCDAPGVNQSGGRIKSTETECVYFYVKLD